MEVLNDLPPQEIDLTAEEGERVLRHIGEFRSATSRDAKVAALVQLTNLLGWSEVLFLLSKQILGTKVGTKPDQCDSASFPVGGGDWLGGTLKENEWQSTR